MSNTPPPSNNLMPGQPMVALGGVGTNWRDGMTDQAWLALVLMTAMICLTAAKIFGG